MKIDVDKLANEALEEITRQMVRENIAERIKRTLAEQKNKTGEIGLEETLPAIISMVYAEMLLLNFQITKTLIKKVLSDEHAE